MASFAQVQAPDALSSSATETCVSKGTVLIDRFSNMVAILDLNSADRP